MKYLRINTQQHGHVIVEEGSPLENKIKSDSLHSVFEGDVIITSYFPLLNPDHSVTIKFDGNVEVYVNVNAYEFFLEEVAKLPETFDENKLYFFNTGFYGEIGICSSLAEQIQSHNWEQYAQQMAEMYVERELTLTKIRKHPNIADNIANPSSHN